MCVSVCLCVFSFSRLLSAAAAVVSVGVPQSLSVCMCACLSVCVFSDSGLLSVTAAAVSAGIPQCLVSTMCIYRCLYDMALDVSDR